MHPTAIVRLASVVLAGSLALTSSAQTVREESILPATTDPAITIALAAHRVAFAPDITHRAQLMVLLHGAAGTAGNGTDVVQTAAEVGFHSVGISYYMDQLPFQSCGNNWACQELFRREIIEGQDYSPHITISRANSIENRLIKLLQHLNQLHPTEGWSDYLDAGQPRWGDIVLYGHSMGACNSAVIAKYHEVAGLCMSAPAGDVPGWWNTPATPADRIFGFSHVQDRFTQVQGVWQAVGLPQFGAVQDVASVAEPYNNTHMLSTSVAPAIPNEFHNSPTTDATTPRLPNGTPVYRPVWVYMMQGGAAAPSLLGDMNCDGLVTVSDIAGFVLALTNPAAYAGQYPTCDIDNGDVNDDGQVTVSDIGAFVALLTG